MSEEQKDRFEFFRRSHFNREAVKKVRTTHTLGRLFLIDYVFCDPDFSVPCMRAFEPASDADVHPTHSHNCYPP